MNGVVEIPLKGCVSPGGKSPAGGNSSSVGLQTFVAGPENRLAEVAVEAVLGKGDGTYSPIVFYGPSGTGKSHLALGLAGAWKACFRREPVIYVTAVDFARGLAEAIQTKTTEDFAGRYRRASLLVLEDVGHLAGKEAAQRELSLTLDALRDAGSRVVITSIVIPAELAEFSPGLRGRLTAGLVVPLAPPSRDARLVILRLVAESLGTEFREGILVSGVLEDGPGDRAGLKPGDLIVAIDRGPITTAQQMLRTIAGKAPGSPLSLTIERDGDEREQIAVVGERPSLAGR